jgi:hypothetical protein
MILLMGIIIINDISKHIPTMEPERGGTHQCNGDSGIVRKSGVHAGPSAAAEAV